MVNGRHKEIAARVKHMNGSTIKSWWTPSDRLEKDIMGKYQLDDKGKAPGSTIPREAFKGGINKKDRVASLREQFLKKAKKNKK